MPYIEQTVRPRLAFRDEYDDLIIQASNVISAGELNYVITVAMEEYLRISGDISYAKLNEVVGVLECAKQEFYRRMATPYENAKIIENGDVYPGTTAEGKPVWL